jgi:serine/threonine protein kinase
MAKLEEWEKVSKLGSGGQSEVFLVRKPARHLERLNNIQQIRDALDRAKGDNLATAIWSFARPDHDSELGALKVFKNRGPEEDEMVGRLRNEIASLSKGRTGLPLLLDSKVEERWLVTEFFPEGTLEHHINKYRGNALRALRAFRSLVETVSSLHKDGLVHRDIKPANVFIRNEDELVLGDFGIVFIPDEAERLTVTNERVGPRDYMPQWGDLGGRLEDVRPNYDVYMLGKLLWCMVSGRLKLPREYYNRPNFNLSEIYPGDPGMLVVNSLLDRCVVEDAHKCIESAEDLLQLVDKNLMVLGRGGQPLEDTIPRPCKVCGQGFYAPQPDQVMGLSLSDLLSRPAGAVRAEFYICDHCGHIELFKTKKRV